MNGEPLRAAFGKFGDRHQFTADARAAPSRRLHPPGRNEIVGLGVREKALDQRTLRARAHHSGLGAAPDKEPQRVDQDRLARAGLTGQDV